MGPINIFLFIGLLLATTAYLTWSTASPSPTPLSAFSAPFVFGKFQVPVANPLTREGVALGRRLFYDKRLSGDNSVACATCHLQHLAFTDGKSVSVGVSGKPLPFSSMSLANLMWGPQKFFWDGRTASLEEQALLPIQDADEMDQNLEELLEELAADALYPELFRESYGAISAVNIARAIASFERTLISSNSLYDRYLRGEYKLNSMEEAGRKLFMAHPDVKVSQRGGNCIDCHSQFLTSGFRARLDGFSNNGLDDEASLLAGLEGTTGRTTDRGKFKAPTLRNIAVTAPYMHDGRFSTLEEVLDHYNGGIKLSSTLSPLILEADNRGAEFGNAEVSLGLSADEKEAIIAFLHTLTDIEFLQNRHFSDPFAKESQPDA